MLFRSADHDAAVAALQAAKNECEDLRKKLKAAEAAERDAEARVTTCAAVVSEALTRERAISKFREAAAVPVLEPTPPETLEALRKAKAEAEAKAATREPMERYVQYFADAVAGDRWSKDYVGYAGLAQKVMELKNYDLLYDGRVMIGDPSRLHAMMEQVLEAGIGELSFVTILPGLEQARVLDSMRLFAEEVMPRYL